MHYFWISFLLILLMTSSMAALHNYAIVSTTGKNSPSNINIIMSRNNSSVLGEIMKGGSSGALAGAIQIVALMWLRTTTNYQYRYNIPMREALLRLYADGGISRFYRGLSWALIQGPASKFGSVAANVAALELISRYYSSQHKMSPILAAPLGSCFSAIWRFLLMPIDTCKTVLQVDGDKGFTLLLREVLNGRIWLLYHGALATMITTFSSHLPWFLVYNILDKLIPKPRASVLALLRHSSIGFAASAFSDIVSNPIRVIKILKQTTISNDEQSSYVNLLRNAINESGWSGLFSRGIGSRIVTNGIQSVIFVIVWRLVRRSIDMIENERR